MPVVRVVAAFLTAEVLLIGSAIAWVAIWSHFLHADTTQEQAEAYAQIASPWVSLVMGMPVFAGLGAALMRWGDWREVLGMVAVWMVVDIAILFGMADDPVKTFWLFLPNAITKAGAAAAVVWWLRG